VGRVLGVQTDRSPSAGRPRWAATSHVGTYREPAFRGWITTLDARDGEGKVELRPYEEVASLFSRMDESSVLAIYQHLPRLHRKLFLYSTFNRLIDRLGCPTPVAISDNTIAFIILAKNRKRQTEVRQALREYTRSHLEIYD
jgi:hypothetical protein